ncbi:DUF2520 domain-containing protein [Acinetobacter haemolyticus]|uniref:DUF2520 domain-containing protein n=2 Tax=Acinetobacter haemolyticus TaxID=29430 RepID=A0AAJ2YUR3_ACIHA|nr:Rossmann-like and DUF2520 domain-containing protein [Acinetobacter haemolyticus]NAR17774.1 DUF2520 domain-containing protein [Acinetobacter haemolyticus]NAR29237.1 DUF2520 domain-containing protein [Acinetobacter haemolyticus]NAR35643.1 DUF2520 domain-containing protein [Acinetobacter haemolyticus]NAR47998.1 DUF2520 domain-containing protein [Acinetobacter haemolyticus]NAR64271.1 DUF2520 domain-containing protein [Acinetobacter haemolyticus]
MRITFIGAGRVATHLAKVLHQQHHIVQVFSRDLANAENLASQVNAQAIDQFAQLDSRTDLVVIAVSDQVIAEIMNSITSLVPQSLIVHTSGSTSLITIEQASQRTGVFYPLQTFSLDRDIDWIETPIFVEASTQADLEILTGLANSLSNRVYQYSSKQRQTLHLAAVFACNFSNYCYDMAQQIVAAEQVDFSLLYPLITETASKAVVNQPKLMQTGPAMRGDQNILKMHQQLLAQSERTDLERVYTLMSDGIFKRHHL